MVELTSQNQTYSTLKTFVGLGLIGTASILSSPYAANGPNNEAALHSYSYAHKCTAEYPCTYQLRNELMPNMAVDNAVEPVVELQKTQSVKVSFNKPVRLKFKSVENELGFIS